MKTQAIIPSAGSGIRLKSKVLKPFVSIGGKPLIFYTLKAFEKSSKVESVILVVPQDKLTGFKKLVKSFKIKKVKEIVSGGKTRKDSVANGIACLDKDTKMVVVHDGARPAITPKLIDLSVETCKRYRAVIVAVPVKPTIKRVDPGSMEVEATLQRDKLWEAQTPQTFHRDILEKAHREIKDGNPTDDSYLIEQMGLKVKIIKGDYRNIKVTTPEDLIIARGLLCNTK
ncbi:MAG: 2-C-methyl-D-erythritol 4-phosphate cytidylyltransferase [Candidatus Omnitrophica bacterium]|nr:2-C-methyl-D-erythritol 4-phosphate cytidylyltransferase [Candidatus Omnitrophota bacterium]